MLLQYVMVNVIIEDEVVKYTVVVHRKYLQKKHVLDLESYVVPQKLKRSNPLIIVSHA